MALHHSPRIVTSGLVLALDAADRNSYLGTGTIWSDLSGVNNGTLVNSPTFNSANGGSIVFDGTDDYVNLLNSQILPNGTNDFTVSVFFKTSVVSVSNGSYRTIYSTGTYADITDPVTWKISLRDNGRIDLWWKNASKILTDDAYNDNKWYCCDFIRQNNIFSLYVNSSLKKTLSETVNFDFLNSYIGVGGSSTPPTDGGYFNGNIAQVKIYNRALSATEILQNYNATKTRFGL